MILSCLPEVVICIDPAMNKNASAKYGYVPTNYYRGGSMDWKFIGWNGVDVNISSTDILNDILNMKLDEEEFKAHVLYNLYFKDRGGRKEFPVIDSRMLLFPHGRCILIKPPNKKVSHLHFYVNTTTLSKSTQGSSYTLNVFLMDPINSPLMFPMNFQMKGDHMKIPVKTLKDKTKSWSFSIRVSRSIHVKDDPLFDCFEYDKEAGTYGDCVRNEMKKIFEERLNCTPPMLATSMDQICNKKFNLTKTEDWEIFELFWNNYFDFEPMLCKRPCSQTTYEVDLQQIYEVEELLLTLTIKILFEFFWFSF